MECQQWHASINLMYLKRVDLGTFACEAWPLLHFVKCGCLRESVLVCACVRERENRGPRTYLCRTRTWHPLSTVGASPLQIEGVCPLIILLCVSAVSACVSQNWVSTHSTSQPCAGAMTYPISLCICFLHWTDWENPCFFPSSTGQSNSSIMLEVRCAPVERSACVCVCVCE